MPLRVAHGGRAVYFVAVGFAQLVVFAQIWILSNAPRSEKPVLHHLRNVLVQSWPTEQHPMYERLQPPGYDLPANVRLVDLGRNGLVERLSTILRNDTERALLKKMLPGVFTTTASMLIQFKPALGAVFEDYLSPYSHWAFGDMDVMMGDLSRHLRVPHELAYDVVTFSFGDQFRGYPRGQLTIHRNTVALRELFRRCENFEGTRLISNLNDGVLNEASSEGCYSKAVATSEDLRVLYTVRAFTDVNGPHHDYRALPDKKEWKIDAAAFHEAIALNNGRVLRCWRQEDGVGTCVGAAMHAQLESLDLQHVGQEEGPAVAVSMDTERRVGDKVHRPTCMWWVPQRYQVCLANTSAHDDVYLNVPGPGFYKRRVTRRPGSGGMVESAFMHFQEWKKAYPYWSVPSTGGGAYAGLLIAKEGFIPVPQTLLSTDGNVLPVGGEGAASWRALMGPGFYCRQFKEQWSRLPKCISRVVLSDDVIRGRGSLSRSGDRWPPHAITLIIVSRGSSDADAVLRTAESWHGPLILVQPSYHRDPSLEGHPNITVVPFSIPDTLQLLPVKAMLNAGLDVVRTRFVLVGLDPLHMELPQDAHARLVASMERLVDRRGSVLLVPLVDAEGVQRGAGRDKPMRPALQEEGVMAAWRSLRSAGSTAGPVAVEVRAVEWLQSPDVAAPVVVVDMMAPHGPVYVRHLEELGAYECYDATWVWSLVMLGYQVYVSPAVHALAIPQSGPEDTPTDGIVDRGCAVKRPETVIRVLARRLKRIVRFYREVNVNRDAASPRRSALEA